MVRVIAVHMNAAPGWTDMSTHWGNIRVMIVNDHPIMRVGLRLAVQRESGMQVACEVGNAAQALLEFERCRPDVVLIDLQLPQGSGLRAIEAIHALSPTSPIVVLTTFPDEVDVPPGNPPVPIMCVSKTAPSEEIMAAIREAERRIHPFG
jgi:DNA-binding NarL/FixJ family response regulator